MPSKENGHPGWDARQSGDNLRYGQVVLAPTNWVFTVTGALLDPSVTVTVAGVGNDVPPSFAWRVIVTVCPETMALTAGLLEVAE